MAGQLHILAKRPLSPSRLPLLRMTHHSGEADSRSAFGQGQYSTLSCRVCWLSLPWTFKSNSNKDEPAARSIDLHLLELRWMSAVSPVGTTLPGCARKALEDAHRVCNGELAVWLALTLFIWVSVQWHGLYPPQNCHAWIVCLWHFNLFFISMRKRLFIYQSGVNWLFKNIL